MKVTKREENRIRELLKKDPDRGLSLAMDHFGPAVKWIAQTVLGKEAQQDIEECIAETFVRLWRSIAGSDSSAGGFEPGAGTTLYSYTCGIARHVAIDMVRHRPKNQTSLEDSATAFAETAEDQDFVQQLTSREEWEVVFEIVDHLDPPDREIFFYRYWLELPVRRIAERLGLTEKQVENHLYRGKKRIRESLKERGITNER